MVPLIWFALTGCLWSTRLHDYEVWVDSPAAFDVSVSGEGVSANPLQAGEGDQTGTFEAYGRTVELTRQSTGIRAICSACGPMQILVGADGRAIGLYQRDEMTLEYGEPVHLERRYELGRLSGDYNPWVTLELDADWSHVRRVEAMQRPLYGVGWAAFGLGLFGILPSLLFLGEEMWVESAATAGATVFLLGWGGSIAFGKRRSVLVWETGDPHFDTRPLKD